MFRQEKLYWAALFRAAFAIYIRNKQKIGDNSRKSLTNACNKGINRHVGFYGNIL